MNARTSIDPGFGPAEVVRAFGGRIIGGNKVRCPAPGCGPTDGSMEVKFGAKYADGFTVRDFYADTEWTDLKDMVRERCGVRWQPESSGASAADIIGRMNAKAEAKANPGPKPAGAFYYYTEADGTVIYRKERYYKLVENKWEKQFVQHASDGDGGWEKNLESLGGRRVLYRWADLVKFASGTVFFCEGEKDADRIAALDQCGTSVDAGKWTDECVEPLRGRDVFILEDNDAAGRKRAAEAARRLHGIAATLTKVSFLDLPEQGDVSDWLDAHGNSFEKLFEYCLTFPKWSPPPEGEAPSSDDEFANAPLPPLIKSSGEFVAGFVPPDYLIDGLMQRRFAYSMTAHTGSGKTAVALLIAALVALKRALGEYQLEGGRVLYLAGENPDDVRMRWIAMADVMNFDINTIDVHFLPGNNFKLSEIASRIEAEVTKIGPVVLVVVDTSAAYFEGRRKTATSKWASMLAVSAG